MTSILDADFILGGPEGDGNDDGVIPIVDKNKTKHDVNGEPPDNDNISDTEEGVDAPSKAA